MVLLGEIRHCVRILFTFTRPYFGTASSMSKTFAVSDVLGRIEQELVDLSAARLEVALELRAPRADLVRALERLHPLGQRALGCWPPAGLGGRLGAAAAWAASLHAEPWRRAANAEYPRIQLDLDLSFRLVTAT